MPALKRRDGHTKARRLCSNHDAFGTKNHALYPLKSLTLLAHTIAQPQPDGTTGFAIHQNTRHLYTKNALQRKRKTQGNTIGEAPQAVLIIIAYDVLIKDVKYR